MNMLRFIAMALFATGVTASTLRGGKLPELGVFETENAVGGELPVSGALGADAGGGLRVSDDLENADAVGELPVHDVFESVDAASLVNEHRRLVTVAWDSLVCQTSTPFNGNQTMLNAVQDNIHALSFMSQTETYVDIIGEAESDFFGTVGHSAAISCAYTTQNTYSATDVDDLRDAIEGPLVDNGLTTPGGVYLGVREVPVGAILKL